MAQAKALQGETKRQKFERVAKRRVDKAAAAIRSIATLKNRRTYEYSTRDVGHIVDYLQEELGKMEHRLGGGHVGDDGFSFDDSQD